LNEELSTPDAPPPRTHDPVVVGGLLLLALLTVGAVLIYASAPRTLAEARTGSWIAARPNAAGAHLARGRERLERALQEASVGRDSTAAALDSVAAEHGWRAATLAANAADQREALALWAEATLHRAEMFRLMGTGIGLRPDDDPTLRRALALVMRVDSISPDRRIRLRADSMRLTIERELRPGPLEWLPR
jgi:hypothetical protein